MTRSEVSSGIPLDIRGWQFHHRDADYLARAIPAAAAQGINHIQLSHNIVHFIDQILDDADCLRVVRHAARLCRDHGLRVYAWTHELNHLPDPLRRGGKVHLDDPALRDYLAEKYARAFEQVPELDGLILTCNETPVPVFKDDGVDAARPATWRITQIVNLLHAICAGHGKELFARTFVYQPEELAWMMAGIAATHPEVRVMTKCVPFDWHPFFPHNPALGQFPGRIQIVEMDPAAEYYGQSLIPFNQVEDMKSRLDHGMAAGCRGAVIRVDRKANPILGTLNEANTHAFSRFAQDPAATPDLVWREWTDREFGPAAAPAIERALRRTFAIVTKMYLTLGHFVLDQHSAIPSRDYADALIPLHSIAKWDPAWQARYEAFVNPNRAFHARAVAEKDEAVALARQSLADVESIRGLLTEAQFRRLHPPLEKLHRCTRLWRDLADAYLAYRVMRHHTTPGWRKYAFEACDRADATASAILAEIGTDDLPWESARSARWLTQGIREAVNGIREE